MHKLKVFILFFISIVFLLTSNSIAFAEEKVTLSTYYPAPIAEYCDLEAEKSFTAGEEGTISDSFTNITPFYGDVIILPQNRDTWVGLEGGNVGIGTDTPTAGAKLEVAGGIIKATGGLIIEARTDVPTTPVAGQLWLRTDIEEGDVGGGESGLVWAVTSNSSSGWDRAQSITSDTDYLYITGYDYASPPFDPQWRVEKRSKSDGSLIWAKTNNPSSFWDYAYSITSDADYLYITGVDQSPALAGDSQWRIEKRSKSNGNLIWAKTSNPNLYGDKAFSIISDANYLYITGCNAISAGDYQWRVEKRFKSNGSLVWAKTSNPSSDVDYAQSIISDTNYLYITGWDDSPGDSQWRIEKRFKSNGNLIWAKTNNPSSAPGSGYECAKSITLDADYLYITGYDLSPGDRQWRIEKRAKSDGSLLWTKTSNPSSRDDWAFSITSDIDYLYITGWDFSLSPGNAQWRIEKRSKSDGSLLLTEISNPSSFNDMACSTRSDGNYLYIAGSDYSTGNGQWRIEKYIKGSSAYTDIGLRAYDGTEVITIDCEPEGTVSSALRIGKGGKIYGIVLVEPTDSDASNIRIKTSSGVKALKKL